MKKSLYFLFTLFFCSLYAEEEIYVRLAGDVNLLPIYLSPIQAEETQIPAATQQEIRSVLAFDLDHNGMTHVLSAKECAKKSLAGQEVFDNTPAFNKLKDEELLYLIKLKLKGTELITKVISVNSQIAHTIDGVKLSGDVAKDRAKIHSLADAIHQLLFGKKGVASCRILFTVKKKVERANQGTIWVSEVFESDYDGFNAKQISHDGSYTANPQYIPTQNGQKSSEIMYVSYKIGQPKLYSLPLAGGTPRRMSPLKGNQVTPSLNKNATMIAFSCDTTGKADIFVQPLAQSGQAAGKPRQVFAAKGAANASPTFSPDGTKIAFVSNKDGSPKIYLMTIPQPGAQLSDVKVSLISKRCRENSAPSWSPDGKKLAYCAKSTDARQIWVYDFETNQERELTQGPKIKENPTWAPNSLHLLFNATDDSGTELYLININQPEAVRITSGTGAKMFPCWEPK
jgi:TolB protein